jgi:transcriptional antiterminator RfaH
MSDWYLVYCKARREDLAARGLQEQDYRVYLPKLKIRRRRAQGMVDVMQPLFPRYLFVSPGDGQALAPIAYTVGVSKLVRFGSEYRPVSAGIVEALKSRADPDTGYHGLSPPKLERGDRVGIRAGAFAGIEGIFEARSGQERVVVLLELLGQKVRTEVAIGELDL